MAQRIINVGSSANKGDGDPIRTAFGKVNDNFTELYGKVTVLEGQIVLVQDVKGDVFSSDSSKAYDSATGTFYGKFVGDLKGTIAADDSTILVDSVAGKLNATALTGALPAIDGSNLTNLTFPAQSFASLTGKPTTVAGYGITDALTSVPAQSFASLTGKPTTISGYGITDAQSTLVSGTSIKTINGTSLLGSGDVTISGGGGADLSAVNQNYTPDTDNAYDLGIAAGNFLRTGYFGTSVVIGDDQFSAATLSRNSDGHLVSSSTISTFGLTSSSYLSITAGFGGLIFWGEEPSGGANGHSGFNGNGEMVWYGGNYSTNGPTYQLDKDKANLQIGGEATKTISGVTLGATTSLSFSDPYYFNPNSTVTITGVVGTTELNNQTYYINGSGNLYTDAALTTPLNSSAFTAYVSGGTAVVAPRATMSLPVLHSPPSSPTDGMMAIADGTNWSPLGGTTPGLTIYYNGQWWPGISFVV